MGVTHCRPIEAPRATGILAGRSPGTIPRPRHGFEREGAFVETYVPAEQPQACQDAWVPGSHADPSRPPDPGPPPGQGPGHPVGIARGPIIQVVDTATLSPKAPGSDPTLRRGDFRRVTQQGRRIAGALMTLHWVPRDEALVRAGFTAGRRVGGAVIRNRARRLLREAWRSVAQRADGGCDLVFVARPDIAGRKLADVVAEMESLLLQAGVIA